jgi:hypothetical protein
MFKKIVKLLVNVCRSEMKLKECLYSLSRYQFRRDVLQTREYLCTENAYIGVNRLSYGAPRCFSMLARWFVKKNHLYQFLDIQNVEENLPDIQRIFLYIKYYILIVTTQIMGKFFSERCPWHNAVFMSLNVKYNFMKYILSDGREDYNRKRDAAGFENVYTKKAGVVT